MAQPFTEREMRDIRSRHYNRLTVARICELTEGHRRDEVIEALDAIRRFRNDREARDHVNRVLAYQACEIPLVNGRPNYAVETTRRHAPMFT